MFFSVLIYSLSVLSEVIWYEGFDDGWEDRWVIANNSEKTLGNLTVEAPKKCMNRERSKSLKTTNESSYYAISADIGRTISTVNKTFIFAYMVKCEQEDLRVGGAYLKLFSENIDQTRLNGSTPYYFMFGWDLERGHPQRVQALLRVKGKEYNHSPPLKLEKDSRTHLFTFIMRPDYTYEIRLDNNKTQAGNMWESWYGYMEPPKFLDPDARKPADWVDLPYIPDPEAKKPRDWNDTMVIEDRRAVRPSNWSDKYLGEWKRPRIPNPKYKGSWMPPVIKNPDYKGEWKIPLVPNPNWAEEREHHGFRKLRYIGVEVFQRMPGTYWDNIIICDTMSDYDHYIKTYWEPIARYEGVYTPPEKSDTFSLSSEDLFPTKPKEPKKSRDEEEEEEDDKEVTDDELWEELMNEEDEDDDDDDDDDDLDDDDLDDEEDEVETTTTKDSKTKADKPSKDQDTSSATKGKEKDKSEL